MNNLPNSCDTKIASTQPLSQRIAAPRLSGRIGLAVLTAGLLFSVAAQAQYNYTTNNSTITITGYTGAGGAVLLTDSITGLPVTSIGDNAFKAKTNLTSVTIPNSVTSIGADAFDGCTGLNSITLSTNVTSIGGGAFFNCRSLTNIVFPASVTSLGGDMFYHTRLTSITIPAAVTNIGAQAFSDCSSLTNITVEAQNTVYSSLAGVLFDNSQTTLIQFPGGKAGSITIPSSATTISDWAFFDCHGLTNVTVPNGVISIGGNQFYNTSLTSIIIPASVTNIGINAFYGCQTLTNITVDPNNPAYGSSAGILLNKSQTTLIQCPEGKSGTVTLPNSVTNILTLAFAYSRLSSLTIPDSVTGIAGSAFYASNLTNITIGSSVTDIGARAFSGCAGLTAVYFRGNAPSVADSSVFASDNNVIVNYLPGATGFGTTYAGRPTTLWTGTPNVIVNATANPANSGVVTGGGTYPVGTNVQITAMANASWQFTGWSDSVTNATRVIAVPAGGATYTANFVIAMTVAAPVITNALMGVGSQFVIVVGETNVFTVSATDAIDNSRLRYQWSFGDGATSAWSAAAVALHVYATNNCGSYTASVTVSNDQSAISSNLTVSAACQLTITKLQLGVSFSKTNADSSALTARFVLPGLTNVIQLTHATFLVDIGNAQVPFTLDGKGRGASGLGTCRLAYTKATKTKPGFWTATIALSKGNWHELWAAYGLDNATHKSPGVSVALPVAVVIGTEAFAVERTVHYTATVHKTGTAK